MVPRDGCIEFEGKHVLLICIAPDDGELSKLFSSKENLKVGKIMG